MRKSRKISILFGSLLVILIVAIGTLYNSFIVGEKSILSAPSFGHWFGTDMIGQDIFIKCLGAISILLATMAAVIPVIYFGGFLVGGVLSHYESPKLKEMLLNLVHYWVTIPVLLLAIFLLILIGASQVNVCVVLIFVLLPSQSLYIYNQLEEAKKQEFVTAKRSCGFSKKYVLFHHLFPYTARHYNIYAFSRLPEILMMDLAFNFLGLGVQPPHSSFGQMLSEGISFMFSAWWIWIFPIVILSFIFLLVGDATKEV